MIDEDGFWTVMAAYNRDILPVQLCLYVLAVAVVVWTFIRPSRVQNVCVKLYCAISFAWTGIVFYMLLGKDIAGGSRGNYFFGALFVVISFLFMLDVFRRRMQFSLPVLVWKKTATLAITILVLCYPLLGLVLGHGFQSLVVPGTFPCPTAALALILLTTSLPDVDKVIYVALLVVSIPFTPFFQIARYGVYEDVVLFATGLYGLILLVRHWRPAVESD